MSRAEKISSIILKRKPLAEEITRKQSSIRKITSSFERLMPVCRTVLNDKSTVSDFAGMSEILDASVKPINELLHISNDLSRLHNRFSRDTLNIAVIGRARQGKVGFSKRLQASARKKFRTEIYHTAQEFGAT
ncbi:MAG: hypothetical protein IJU48_04665 [Synergistaceae bacterium]|nr:hypothetical protein [Synergistaceae bacterium]